MSTAPRGSVLFRYTPGVGRVPVVQCGTSPTATCASAFSTGDQTLTAGTAAVVVHDSVDITHGITVSSNSFTVPEAGVYKIIPSLQVKGSGNGTVMIWLKVNGVNVANSATLTAFKNNDEHIITCEYLLTLDVGQSVQVWALAQSSDCVIDTVAAGGSGANAYPAAPGVITNMYRIR